MNPFNLLSALFPPPPPLSPPSLGVGLGDGTFPFRMWARRFWSLFLFLFPSPFPPPFSTRDMRELARGDPVVEVRGASGSRLLRSPTSSQMRQEGLGGELGNQVLREIPRRRRVIFSFFFFFSSC